MPSLRSFWVVLFSTLLLVLSALYVSLVGGGLSTILKRQLDGASELYKLQWLKVRANTSKVVFLGWPCFLPPAPQSWRCFPSSYVRVAVFPSLSLSGGGVFPPPLFGWRTCPPSRGARVGAAVDLFFC